MIATLGNSELTVEIDDLGAELSRIHSADGCQYLWPGDPAIWPERSPLLFPIVGGLWGDTYRLDGRAYELGRHGFARKMGFELHDLSDRQATYVLTDSPRTRSVYPFGFRLEVRYTLEGGCITVDYRLTHPESVPLPFSIGAHPGFLCQWQAGDTLEDYYLEWENAETAEAHVLQNGYRRTPTRIRWRAEIAVERRAVQACGPGIHRPSIPLRAPAPPGRFTVC